MQEPQHPVGPAFERTDAREELLTPQQREAYILLNSQLDKSEEAARLQLRATECDQIIQKMQRHFTEKPAPAYKRNTRSPSADPLVLKRIHDAVPDFAVGKKTPETKLFKPQLTRAHNNASLEVRGEQQAAMKSLLADQKKERDAFLTRCARERNPSRSDPGHLAKEESPGKSNDDAMRTAIEKAARRESDRDRDPNEKPDRSR